MTEPTAKGNAIRDRSTEFILRELRVAKAAIAVNPEATCRHLDNLIDLLTLDTKREPDQRPTIPSGPTLSPWQAKRVHAFVDANLDRAIPIQELADIAQLSVGHFFRAFRGSFGTAPHSYIVARRIERAERRLRESESSLAEVALDCGFADQAHFSRAFAKHAGLPPGAWRRTLSSHNHDDLDQSA
tara:strand:- start:5535 stop:6092 length:558 start_codon:yes stop_codon:yes gene_type:complete